MKIELEIEITDPGGERVDLALIRALGQAPGRAPEKKGAAGISRRRLKASFTAGSIRRAGGRALAPSDHLPPGRVRLEIDHWESLSAPERAASASAEGAFLPIVYEDEDLLVLHKRSGVPSLPHTPEESGATAVGSALARVPGLPVISGRELEPGLLHRLDTQTSGLLVFAKSETEWSRLRALWRSGSVRKFYRACVSSSPGSSPSASPARIELATASLPFLIDTPLGHDARSAKRMLVLTESAGQARNPAKAQAKAQAHAATKIRGKPLPARTHLLESHALGRSAEAYDLLLRIETGVMHQIRCHLSSIGWPILGDPIYRGGEAPRLWLHAWRIELPSKHGACLVFEACLPADWPGKGEDPNA